MKCVLTIPRDRDPAARELLDDHRVGRQVQPHPAVLLGDGHAEQAELAHLRDDRLRELVGGVVVLRLRDDLLVDELADHLEDRLLLVGLLEERGRDGHARSYPASYLAGELHPRRRRERAAAAPARWSSWPATARRREWTFGELARRRRSAGRRAARARRPPRRRRPHAGRKPPGVGADDARLLPPGLRRAALHRAAAPEGPRSCGCAVAQPRLVVADARNAATLREAGWTGDTLWVPFEADASHTRRRPPSSRPRTRA